jgi:hypothetical protein
MMKTKNLLNYSLVLFFLLMVIGVGACSSGNGSSAADAPVIEVEQSESQETAEEVAGSEAVEEVEEQDIDPEAAWLSSPHADTFVLDAEDNNNTCARCHAPVNWQPSMDDLPESCFTCKFELEDPPPYISEGDWLDIPCFVCHEKDKKDNIQPEYTWLEIAAIEEYAPVDTPTELCQKCHNEADVPGHAVFLLGGAHSDYECIECHDAHDTVASCGAVDCHEDVIGPATPIAGHDDDHMMVSCEACHDGGGLDVGPREDDGIWKTFMLVPSGDGEVSIAYTSHNIVLDAPCERCHFVANPWGLTEAVNVP